MRKKEGNPRGKKKNGKVSWQLREDADLKEMAGTFLMVQRIRLHASNAGGPGSIPGQGTRSHMHAAIKNLHATTKEAFLLN